MYPAFEDMGKRVSAPLFLSAVLGPICPLLAAYHQHFALPESTSCKQTIDGDIADFGGTPAAYDAYHASLHGEPARKQDGFPGDQQFYIRLRSELEIEDPRSSAPPPDPHRRHAAAQCRAVPLTSLILDAELCLLGPPKTKGAGFLQRLAATP